MAIIKQISVYDGNSWTLDDIGVNAENVNLSANSSVTLNSILPADKLTTSKALMTDGNGVITTSSVSSSQLGYLSGVSSAIQTQLNGKVSKSGDTMTGNISITATTPSVNLINNAITIGTNPSSNRYDTALSLKDENNDSYGSVITNYYTDGKLGIAMQANRPISDTQKYNSLRLLIKNDGTNVVAVTDQEPWRTGLGVPPISHASSATTYGVGTTANYGHCMTINNLTTSAHANGKALSAYQGYVLNSKIKFTTQTASSTVTSLANEKDITLATITLAAGSWLLVGCGGCKQISQTNNTARFNLIISTSSSSWSPVSYSANIVMPMSKMGDVYGMVNCIGFVTPTASTSYYLRAYQNSGAAQAFTQGRILAIKVG